MENTFNRIIALITRCLVPIFLVLPVKMASASIMITEIMQNPLAVSDTNGEWFEVYNSGSTAMDLNGWTIKDNGSDSHFIVNGGPLLIVSGGFLVFGRNGDSLTNGGVAVDYVYSEIGLANGIDELILLDDILSEIDSVEWDDGATYPDPNGASMALLGPGLDNKLGSNWEASVTVFGQGDRGSPGAPNNPHFMISVDEPNLFALIAIGFLAIGFTRCKKRNSFLN